MKRTMLIGIASLILIVLLVSSSLQASEQPKVRIWADKDTFLVREPIIVHYEIKNPTDSTLFLDPLKEEHFVITDKEENIYRSHIKGFDMGVDYLKPGATRNGSTNICDQYGIVNIGEYNCYLDLFPAVVIYPPQFERTKSNTIIIEVVEPKGEKKEL